MIRRRQFSSRIRSKFAKTSCLASRRLISSLAFAALLGVSLITSPVRAQSAYDFEAGGIEFELPDGEQPGAPYAPGTEPALHEIPEAFFPFDPGTSRGCGDCPPAWRVRVEGLLLNYGDDKGATLSNNFSLRDFDHEEGARVSVVWHWDCLDAWEVAYVGPYEWLETGQVVGAGLTSRLSSNTINLSEFTNATAQSQSYRTQLDSAEFNRRWYGWDVISTLFGVRYLNVGEDFLFNSTGGGGTGLLSIETKNMMAGPQIGMDLVFPVGNLSTKTTIKGALMVNNIDGNVRLVNAGVVEVANSGNDRKLTSLVEIGYYAGYQLTPRVRVHGGYELWWLNGFATATSQIGNPITGQSGSGVNGKNDVYYHGVSAGIEIVW